MRNAYVLSLLLSAAAAVPFSVDAALMNMDEMETRFGFLPGGTINCATRNQVNFPVKALYIISGSEM